MTLREWLEDWQDAVESGASSISRQEAIKRYGQHQGKPDFNDLLDQLEHRASHSTDPEAAMAYRNSAAMLRRVLDGKETYYAQTLERKPC